MAHYDFDLSLLFRPQFSVLIIDGVIRTLVLALLSGLLSFGLGIALAALRQVHVAPVRIVANGIAHAIRNIPALFWIMFFYFALPELLPAPIGSLLHEWPHYAFVAGILGLAADNSVYLSDIIRNGMVTVHKGQREAAASCGLSAWQECVWILCPQSLRSMMPAIANRMIHNFKNTSLCVAIALPELTWATQQVESVTFKGLEVTAAATLIYATGSFTIAFLLSRFNRKKGHRAIRSDDFSRGPTDET